MLLWKYNLHISDLPHFKLKYRVAGKIVGETWCNFNYCSVDHVVPKSYIYPKMIWDNLNVHIGNKPVFWDDIKHAGYIYIIDLLDDNSKLKSIEKLNLELGINMDFLQ